MTVQDVVVDFVARGDTPDVWKMVLVEAGPWESPFEDELRRVQARLYGCVDAALDGLLSEKFPESNGKKLIIQLDCYDLPRAEVTNFFERFSQGVFCVPEYQEALTGNEWVADISFELNFELREGDGSKEGSTQ